MGTYEGQWENGKQNGRGVHEHVNGEKYEGEWVDGRPHGWGKCILVDGTITSEGIWRRGVSQAVRDASHPSNILKAIEAKREAEARGSTGDTGDWGGAFIVLVGLSAFAASILWKARKTGGSIAKAG